MKTASKESKETRIRNHGERLLAIFPDANTKDPFTLCKKLRALERKAARIALQLCNGPEFENEDDADKAFDAILSAVRNLLFGIGTESVPIFINRDPRGYQLKIRDEWMVSHQEARIERDWGGYGILAPEIK